MLHLLEYRYQVSFITFERFQDFDHLTFNSFILFLDNNMPHRGGMSNCHFIPRVLLGFAGLFSAVSTLPCLTPAKGYHFSWLSRLHSQVASLLSSFPTQPSICLISPLIKAAL